MRVAAATASPAKRPPESPGYRLPDGPADRILDLPARAVLSGQSFQAWLAAALSPHQHEPRRGSTVRVEPGSREPAHGERAPETAQLAPTVQLQPRGGGRHPATGPGVASGSRGW
jgi:hypothetical protein